MNPLQVLLLCPYTLPLCPLRGKGDPGSPMNKLHPLRHPWVWVVFLPSLTDVSLQIDLPDSAVSDAELSAFEGLLTARDALNTAPAQALSPASPQAALSPASPQAEKLEAAGRADLLVICVNIG